MSNFIDKVLSTTFTNGLNETQLIEEITSDPVLSALTIDYTTDGGLNKDEDTDNVRITFTTVPTAPQIAAYNALVDGGAHVAKAPANFVLDNQGLAGTVVTFSANPTSSIDLSIPNVASDTLSLLAASQVLTNKTFDADNNTVSNISNSNIKSGANIDAAKIGDGSVSTAVFNYIQNLSSDAQTQIGSRIVGPGTVTDNSILRFNGTTGLSVQASDVILDDNDIIGDLGGIILKDISSPVNPGLGLGILYKKTGQPGLFYKNDDVGSEIDITTNSGVTDHTLLSNIGTNTHAQIDSHISTSNIHIDHSGVLINTNSNSGLSGGGNITSSRNLSLDINNLSTAPAVDASNDTVAIYDNSGSNTVKTTIQSLLNSGISTNLSANIVSADNTITVNSSNYQLMDNMEIVNPPAGTYIMWFNTTFKSGQNNLVGEYGFFLAGSLISNSRRTYFPRNSNAENAGGTQTIVTVNGSQTVDIRWKRNSNTFTAFERSIIYIRIA